MLGWLLGSLASAWPVVTGGVLSMGPPVAADLDGDGLLEVVFPAGDGDLYIVDRDGSVLHQVPIATTSSPSSGAAVADLTGDDRLEIVVIGVDNFVYGLVHIIDADGTVLAQQNINQISSATPVIVDSDFDGANELYISEVGHPFPLYAWTVGPGLQLGPKWTFEVPDSGIGGPPAFVDLDDDDALELLVQTKSVAHVLAVDDDGVGLWQSEMGDRGDLSPPVAADLACDGSVEALLSSLDGSLWAFDAQTGVSRWQFSPGLGALHAPPAVADIDGDGLLEVFVGVSDTGSGWMFSLDHTGAPIWEWQLQNSHMGYSEPSVVDLDGDGQWEVVFGTATQDATDVSQLVVLDATTGLPVWIWPAPAAINSSVIAVDLGGGPELELVFGVYDGTYRCLDHTGAECVPSAWTGSLSGAPWPREHLRLDNVRWTGTSDCLGPTTTSPGTPSATPTDPDGPSSSVGSGAGGCGCATGSGPSALGWLGGLLLAGVRRGQRRAMEGADPPGGDHRADGDGATRPRGASDDL